jgi:glycosidase
MIPETDAIYQIYLRNFTREGTFRAAIPQLARIAAMGFDWVYLTPVHPIGKTARKGSLGSPYAIYDYRELDPELGPEADFAAFVEAAHAHGLKVMIDVVYNHTSPDSALVREHPDWFLRGPDGRPWRKCVDWSDVVDFDYQTSPHLWVELIDTLAMWRDRGVDGFRCDVASLVPADFWKQARMRVNQYDPGARTERVPLVWLAESVHPAFLRRMRQDGYGAWSEPELHAAAFDLSYDYDGWERLEKVWKHELPIERYLEYLYVQETLYPKGAKKLRYLENHDQERIAHRLAGAELRAWTALYQFLPGVAMAYMGQEMAIDHRPDLFERDPIEPECGDPEFERYFRESLKATKEAKKNAPFFSWSVDEEGRVYCLRSVEATSKPQPVDRTLLKKGNYLLVARTRGEPAEEKIGASTALFSFEGTDLLSGDKLRVPAGGRLPDRPAMLIRLED